MNYTDMYKEAAGSRAVNLLLNLVGRNQTKLDKALSNSKVQSWLPRLATRWTYANKVRPRGSAIDAKELAWLAKALGVDLATTVPGKALVKGTVGLAPKVNPFGKQWFARRFPLSRPLGVGGYAYLLASMFPAWSKSKAQAGASKAKAGWNNLVDYMNDTDKGVGTRLIAGPQGSVVSLFNPASGLTGGVDYVPAKWIDIVQKVIPGEAGKTTAHLTAKGGAMALLAAGLVGSYRLGKHLSDLGAVEKADRPGKGMAGQLSTTFEGDLSGEEEQKKAASEERNPYDIYSPGNFTAQNLTATALPIGTLLLAAGLTYKGIDSVFDKLRNRRLDKAIDQKEQAVKKLITARAQIAKGGQSMEGATAATAPLKDSAVYTKEAAQDKIAVIPETVQLFGTLSAAVILASAIGAYSYASAADENNIKYKAYRKALKEYAKAKSGMSPITMAPTNAANYFAAIDAAKGDKALTPRQQPSYDSDALNKPISVSF